MKLKYTALFLFIAIVFLQDAVAQDNCPSATLYKTKIVRDGKDTSGVLHLPLNFIISPDSIIVSVDEKGKAQFMAFRIMGKECTWNKDFSEGKSVYKLFKGGVMERQFPTLTISSDKFRKNEIVLLYENGQIRIFGEN